MQGEENEIDYGFDPKIRSNLLVDVLKELVSKGTHAMERQKTGQGETYYIIHPVLKHIAVLSCNS